MTKNQIVTKLELDTALFALAVSESGILAGAGVTLGAALLGFPALLGAVAYTGFTLAAALSPESADEDFEKIEDASAYFSPTAIMAMPFSPFVSPKDDPMAFSRAAGFFYDATDVPGSIHAALGYSIGMYSSASDGFRDIRSLVPPSQRNPPSNLGPGRVGSPNSAASHESVRPFNDLDPGSGETSTPKGQDKTQNTDPNRTSDDDGGLVPEVPGFRDPGDVPMDGPGAIELRNDFDLNFNHSDQGDIGPQTNNDEGGSLGGEQMAGGPEAGGFGGFAGGDGGGGGFGGDGGGGDGGGGGGAGGGGAGGGGENDGDRAREDEA